MANFIVIAVIAVIVGASALYICKAKKRGVKCVGCPDSGSCASKSCSGNCGGCCGKCGCH